MSAIQDLPTGIGLFDRLARLLTRITALFSALGTLLILGIMLLIGADVIGRGAAATADDANTEIVNVMMMKLGQFFRSEVVVRATVNNARKSGIG